MTVLNDKQIITIQRHKTLIYPWDQDLLNGASYDVTLFHEIQEERDDLPAEELARWYYEKDPSLRWKKFDISGYSKKDPYWIEPNEFFLACTIQRFWLPDDIACEFKLTSSRAREGFDNALAVWGDPGWNDSMLTLELRNNSPRFPVPIFSGMIIGQMVFHQLEGNCIKSYRHHGRYNGQTTAEPSKGMKR